MIKKEEEEEVDETGTMLEKIKIISRTRMRMG